MQHKERYFQVLIEEDTFEGDFIAYIPAIRLGARGESLEEVRENARDVLQMELESRLKQGKDIPSDNTATMEKLSILLPAIK